MSISLIVVTKMTQIIQLTMISWINLMVIKLMGVKLIVVTMWFLFNIGCYQ